MKEFTTATPSVDFGFSIPEKLAATDKPIGEHNPIASNVFFADPTAIEYNGRLYVYGTSDQQEFDVKVTEEALKEQADKIKWALENPEEAAKKTKRDMFIENGYGAINTLVCMSSADMVNWTYHGIIPVTKIAKWAFCSWAPSIVSRKAADGSDEFFLYFANSGAGVGVLKSNSPVGPWIDPIGKPLIHPQNTQELATDPVCWCFDPGVCVDDNGVGWLSFGGGNPMSPEETPKYTGNCRLVKLADDMVSLDSEIIVVPAPYHFEANELNFINGTYVLTYCSNWVPRTEWSEEETGKPAPTICSMCYVSSKTPLDPKSWVYGGEYLANPNQHGYPTSNNHSHLHKFGDKYYLFYQNVSLLENADLIRYNVDGFRSLGVDECPVDESTSTILLGAMTDKGTEQIANVDAFALNPAVMAVTTAAVKYDEDDSRIFASLKSGSWFQVSGVDFKDGANAFEAVVKGEGIIEVRLNALDGESVGSVQFKTNGTETVACKLNKTVSGTHDVYFVAGGSFEFDEWNFAE